MNNVMPRILIVDDEQEITEILADLSARSTTVIERHRRNRRWCNCRRWSFSLSSADITMPGMSGLDMIPHVKNYSPNTVVVMISGMQTVESAIGALRLGAFDYLMKPFDPPTG
jgi:DNA-binding NtrC family response regulator